MSSLGFFHNTSEQNVIDYHGSRNCEPSFAITGERGISFSQPQPGFPLVMVGVAGTVHRGNSCLGIFELILGLILCPFVENTWKIKFINLRIVRESFLAPGASRKPAVTFEQSDLEAFYNVITLCGNSEVRFNVRQAADSGTGDQISCSGNETLLKKRELSLSNTVKH
jgi:hypothetical protein